MQQNYKGKEVLLILGTTILFLIGAVFYDLPLVIGILPGIVLLLVSVFQRGYTSSRLWIAMKLAVKRNKEVAWLLSFVGIILPTWYLSGTIEHLNQLFLSLISYDHFLLISFIITAAMSLILGSAVGSLSIVGVPIMAAAQELAIPEVWIAGALISGAFVGDRTSPLSSSFQLLTHSLEIDSKRQLKQLLPTLIFSLIICTALFYLFDLYRSQQVNPINITQNTINLSLYQLLISLIPPALLMLSIMLGAKMKQAFIVSIVAAFIILIIRGVSISVWLRGIVNGSEGIGGFIPMVPFIMFIFIVGIYCQVLEDAQIVQPYINKIFTNTSSLTRNTIQTVGVAAGISFISPNQSFPIILTGRSLLSHWSQHFHRDHLARVLADSTVVFAGMIPWSLLAILCSTLIGVPVIHYIPFALFLFITPIVTVFYSMYVTKIEKREEYGMSQKA